MQFKLYMGSVLGFFSPVFLQCRFLARVYEAFIEGEFMVKDWNKKWKVCVVWGSLTLPLRVCLREIRMETFYLPESKSENPRDCLWENLSRQPLRPFHGLSDL